MQDQQDYCFHYRHPEINYRYNVRSLNGPLGPVPEKWLSAIKMHNLVASCCRGGIIKNLIPHSVSLIGTLNLIISVFSQQQPSRLRVVCLTVALWRR